MTISVANTPLTAAAGLSEQGRLVLSFIDGGTQWLNWALNDPGADHQFSDETALVSGVQQRLHGSKSIPLPDPGMTTSPTELMNMPLDALRRLAGKASEAGSSIPPTPSS